MTFGVGDVMVDSTYDVEFNGPFPDWWNVVTDFGADPTGVMDSTPAFQSMLDAMCRYGGTAKDGRYLGYTGYIPNGTYKINRLLMPRKESGDVSGEGVNLWGQDPEKVILKWTSHDDAMLWSDGCHSSTIARITFDGQGVASAGVRLERDPEIPVSNSYSRLQDCIFKDMAVGFAQTDHVPGTGTDSEFSILRCRFYRCSTAGVHIAAAEAYDFWVRQCYFEDCRIGIGNGPSGAFSAYDNLFVRSSEYDIHATAMRLCGIRRNRSFNSNRFLYVDCCNSVIESNEVFDSAMTDTVQLINRFKVMLLNNKFKSLDGTTTGPVIKETVNPFYAAAPAPFAPLFVFSNQFTVDNAISIVPQTPVSNDIEGNVVNTSLTIPMAAVVPFPSQVFRQTFYIDVVAEPAQETIDRAAVHAATHPGSRPVVYLPSYNYGYHGARLDRTVIFPASIEMSFQGGGNRATFSWIPETRDTHLDPYVLFRGPSKVVVQNLHMGLSGHEGHKRGLIAVADNCDQVGGRVLMDNCAGIPQFRDIVHLKADLCDYVVTSYSPENLPFLVASPLESTGDGRVLHEGGAGSDSDGNEPMTRIVNGGRYYLREFWYETTNIGKRWAELVGMGAQPGHFSIEASLIQQQGSPDKWNMKAIEATDWWGSVVYADSLIIGTTQLSGVASRVDYLSFGGGSPIRQGSNPAASWYRQDGIPFQIGGFWTMDLTQETMGNNSGWGAFGMKPTNWQARLWDIISRSPTTPTDILPEGVTDMRFHRVRGDITYMSGVYTLAKAQPVTTDFISGVLPIDATYSRTSPATIFDATRAQVYAPENTSLYSQDLSNTTDWLKLKGGTGFLPIAIANDAIAPDGTTTATKLDFDSGSGVTTADFSIIWTKWFDSFLPESGYALNFWYKGAPGTKFVFTYDDTASPSNYGMLECNGEWQIYQSLYNSWYGPAPSQGIAFGIWQDTAAGSVGNAATVWIWGVQLDRSFKSTRPYLMTTGSSAYGPRFDRNPETSALLGILIEPPSTNHIPSSYYAYNWTGTNCSHFPDGATISQLAPFRASKLTAEPGVGDHYAGATAPAGVGAGANVAHSAFVKAGSTRYVVLLDASDAVPHAATFDFEAGRWIGTGTNVALLPPTKLMSDWWRISWIAAMTNDVGAVQLAPTPNGSGTISDINYDATGGEYVIVSGLQLDSDGVGVTSYIPTFEAAGTRSAEILHILRDDGVYDVEIVRQDGTQALPNLTVTGGSFTVPFSTSPLMRVVTKKRQ